MEQKEYWNSVSEKKEFTTPFQLELFERYVEKDARIADIGCGYGRILNELHRAGYTNLTGYDFSENMIKRGESLFPHLQLEVKNTDRIDVPDGSFDAVLLAAVLTCIAKDEEQEKLISEIYRVLKPDGIFYINDFLLNTDDRNLERYENYRDRLGVYGVFELPEGAIVRHHSEERVKELLRDFSRIEYERLTYTTMNGHTSNGFYYIGRK